MSNNTPEPNLDVRDELPPVICGACNTHFKTIELCTEHMIKEHGHQPIRDTTKEHSEPDKLDDLLDFIENYAVSSSNVGYTKAQYTDSRNKAKAQLYKLLIEARLDEARRARIDELNHIDHSKHRSKIWYEDGQDLEPITIVQRIYSLSKSTLKATPSNTGKGEV